jgi:hypothetical protein
MTITDILTNHTVEEFTIREHGSCSLIINGGYSLTQESLLRYIGKEGDFISSLDHKHQFGLPAPYNAGQAIRDKIKGKVIRHVEVSASTGDLTLFFDDGRIEIICTSRGYEAYQIYGPNNFIMVARGGCQHWPPLSRTPKRLDKDASKT